MTSGINSYRIPRILFDNQNLITKTEISNEKTVVFSYNLTSILPHEKNCQAFSRRSSKNLSLKIYTAKRVLVIFNMERYLTLSIRRF